MTSLAKKYNYVFEFVEVMPKLLSVPFSQQGIYDVVLAFDGGMDFVRPTRPNSVIEWSDYCTDNYTALYWSAVHILS